MSGHVSKMEGQNAFKMLAGKPTGMISLGRPRHRWEGNRMDLKKISVDMRNWVD